MDSTHLSQDRRKWRTVMAVQYGDNCMRHRAAYDRAHRLKTGGMNVVADAHSARPLTAMFVHSDNLKTKFPLK